MPNQYTGSNHSTKTDTTHGNKHPHGGKGSTKSTSTPKKSR